MTSPSLIAFVVGAGLLALWIDVRWPGLAPESFVRRMLAAGAAFVLLEAAPLILSSASAAYLTLLRRASTRVCRGVRDERLAPARGGRPMTLLGSTLRSL